MSCGLENSITSPIGNVDDDVQNHSVSELFASLQLVSRRTSFEEFEEILGALQRGMNGELEHLRREKVFFKNEIERLNSDMTRRKDELRKCRASRDECAAAERPGGGGGGGGASLKEMLDLLIRKNELEREKMGVEGEKRKLENWVRDMGTKFKDLDQRVLKLERRVSMQNAQRRRQ